jgi:hypothetical protein
MNLCFAIHASVQNMLLSLSGKWELEPIKVHPSALPPAFFTSSSSNSSSSKVKLLPSTPGQHLSLRILSPLANSSTSGGSSSSKLLPGLPVDSDGNVTATLVKYEQQLKPKGVRQLGQLATQIM